jgi:hypothetical protein
MIYRERHPDVHQEPDTVPIGRIALVAFAALGISVIMGIIAAMMLASDLAELRPSDTWPEARSTRLGYPIIIEELFEEVGPGQRLASEGREALGKFRWVGPAGVEGAPGAPPAAGKRQVGLPIDAAMELIVEEGRK